MKFFVCAVLSSVLLAPSFAWAQEESEPAEPHYHWPTYPPFSPGSWAWPTPGWWHIPSPYGQYGPAQQLPRQSSFAPQPPQTIIVFAPAPPPAYAGPPPSQSSPSAKQPETDSKSPQRSPLYLIAFTDGVIRPALSYSVEGNTLHYTDLDHAARQVPLDRVDRAFSTKLNRQRGVPFRLPEK